MTLSSLLPWIVAQVKDAAEAAAGAADVAQEAAGGDGLTMGLRFLVAIGLLVGAFVIGAAIARWLKVPEYSFRVGLILFVAVASVVVCITGWPPKRGIDLSGGVVLVYEVDRENSKPSWMPTALSYLNSELKESGATARAEGATQIEIEAPAGFDPVLAEKAVRGLRGEVDLAMHGAGKREENGKTVYVFRIDDAQKAVEMDKLVAAVSRRINPGGVKELTIRQYGAEQLEVIIPEVDKREIDQIKRRISTSGLLEFRIVANENDDRDIIRAGKNTPSNDVYLDGKLVGRWVRTKPDFVLPPKAAAAFRTTDRGQEVLVRIDPYSVDGSYLERATQGFDQGQYAVLFTFDAAGAQKFGQLTSHNLPDRATGFFRHLGIVLDNEMISAPSINDTIRDNGQITGNFTEEEVQFLVGVLNAGSLPATLRPEPISEQRISAQLGDDTIRSGSLAMLYSTLAILVFMLIYYRWSGMVADLAVVLNVVITVALMILIKAAFTLPGLAGLVLSVGMAVDANVLIYERIREETARGASLRMAIRNGFARATGTIIDSNVTTLITAMVLYVIGTDQIKGFAVTLILGLLVSMFTAIYVSRAIFDIAEKRRWITQLKMMRIVGETHYDFIRWRGPAIAVSLALIVIGMVAAGARGKGLLDIDFTGGSSVQLQFAEGKQRNIAEVRTAVAALPDVAVSSMGENNLDFKIDTSEKDIKKVESMLTEKFGENLQHYSMAVGKLSTIEAAKPAASPDQAEAAEPATTTPAAAETPPTSEKPAEAKPEETKPEETTPAESKPGEAKPEEPAAPTENPQSRLNRKPTKFRLASWPVSQALATLAVAQEPAAAEAAAEQKPAETAPAETPATDKPAESTTTGPAEPATEKATEAKPAETPAAETRAAEPAEAAADKQPAETGGGGSLVGGTRVALTFPQKIGYEPLAEMVTLELKAMNLPATAFALRNPKYAPGSDASYESWTLEIGLDQAQTQTLLDAMQQQLDATPVFPSSNQIGGKVAGDTQLMALYAMLASMVMIVIYVWVRFQNFVFGLAAVVALLHDVLVAVAFLAASYYIAPYLGFLQVDPFKISLAVVAGLLTIVGFSINDTIVIFDRIREVRGKSPELTSDMINLSVNQTLSRTLLTSGTVFIAAAILYFVGGPGIHAFGYTMLIGVIAGTYSSVYIAAPILLWLKRPSASTAKTARKAGSLGSDARRAGAGGVARQSYLIGTASRGSAAPDCPRRRVGFFAAFAQQCALGTLREKSARIPCAETGLSALHPEQLR